MKALYGIILALFFILLGVMGIILPWSTNIRTEVVDFLLSNTVLLTLFGFAFLTLGLGVIFQMIHGLKRKYVTIKTDGPKTKLSEEVFEDYLKLYFEEIFPKTEVPCRVTLKRKKAKVMADLPFVAESEQEPLIRKIEEDLSDIFRELVGWRHELLFAVSFAPGNKHESKA